MARLLHVVSPLMAGPDVAEIQRALAKAGYRPGPNDGKYGVATEHAVREFQSRHGLEADGVFGPKTRAALFGTKTKPAPKPKPPAPVDKKADPGYLSLVESLKHLGVKESPPGSNKQMFGAWFGVNGVFWCAEDTSYCTKVGADFELCHGATGPGVVAGKGCAYVPTIEGWLRATGMWVGRAFPVSDGWVAIFNWDGGEPDHIGLTATEATLRKIVPHALDAAIARFGPLGQGDFWTAEGNTGPGNDSNGGEHMLRKRNLVQIDGFGRLRRAA